MTNDKEQQERERFEESYEARQMPAESGWFKRGEDGDYVLSYVQAEWQGWQARANLEVDAPAYPYAWVYEFNDPDPQVDIEFSSECPEKWKRKGECVFPLFRANLEATSSAIAKPVRLQRFHPEQGWSDVSAEDVPHYQAKGQQIRELYAHPDPTIAKLQAENEALRAQVATLLGNCRDAVLALAHASESNPIYIDDYEKLTAAIAEQTKKGGE